MIVLFQFDAMTIVYVYGAIAASYLLNDRRMRKIEGQLNRLIGQLETEEERDR
jgi:hypothetical protein